MKLPEKIKVGGYVYNVLFPYVFRERSDYVGQADHAMLEIRLDEKDACGNVRPDSKIISSLIHEVIHCISSTWEIDLEEKQVLQLESGIFSVIVDNWPEVLGGLK